MSNIAVSERVSGIGNWGWQKELLNFFLNIRCVIQWRVFWGEGEKKYFRVYFLWKKYNFRCAILAAKFDKKKVPVNSVSECMLQETLMFLTFMLSCIVTCDRASWQISYYKPTSCTNFSNLFWKETCRVSFQNKFEKFVHLVGLFIRNIKCQGHKF
jgi:hypothetical protein